jgi:hypothetical protein
MAFRCSHGRAGNQYDIGRDTPPSQPSLGANVPGQQETVGYEGRRIVSKNLMSASVPQGDPQPSLDECACKLPSQTASDTLMERVARSKVYEAIHISRRKQVRYLVIGNV